MLDDDFFTDLNESLSENQKQTIAQNIYSQLEDRVGQQMESQLSDEQFQEFETMLENSDETQISAWLQTHAPGYEQLISSSLQQLKQEVKADPAKFLEI